MSKDKRIHRNDVTGQRGINLIEKATFDMGFIWYSTGLEAGIDGYIEIRDPETGIVTNCIVQVQSKATLTALGTEDSEEFSYSCDEADLKYWLAGTAPVILIRSNPDTGEVYWASIKERFASNEIRNARTIRFNKKRDVFDARARESLVALAVPKDSGLYLRPITRIETIETNLLHITDFPKTYFAAETKFSDRKRAMSALLEVDKHFPGAWTIKGGTVLSLHDLREFPWTEICERGTVEELPLEEWAIDEDKENARDFVRLMNLALSDTLRASKVIFDHDERHYYFRAPKDLVEWRLSYQARSKASTRSVFKGYPAKTDPSRMAYYRHSAMKASFRRTTGIWYLEITPTYRFTSDGRRLHPKHQDLLSKIQSFDGALAVANQVVMWADFLGRYDLFSRDERLIGFGKLRTFELDAGIDDAAWLKTEEDGERLTSEGDERQLLLGFN